MTRAKGTDVSFWQDDNNTIRKINFQQMRDEGVDFTIMRVGQNYWMDPDFQDYAKASSLVNGLLRGSYWFYDSRNYIENQCTRYWNAIKDWGLVIPPVMDFETASVTGIATNRWSRTFFLSLIGEFLTTMDEMSGKSTMFYTNPGWLKYLSPLPAWLTKRTLWVAFYSTNESYLVKDKGLFGFPDWRFWQHTDKGDGKKLGVESLQIDLNVYNGTREELEKWLGIAPPQEYTLEEKVDIMWNSQDWVSIQ